MVFREGGKLARHKIAAAVVDNHKRVEECNSAYRLEARDVTHLVVGHTAAVNAVALGHREAAANLSRRRGCVAGIEAVLGAYL